MQKKKKKGESDGRVILDQVVTLKEVILSLCYPFFCESRTKTFIISQVKVLCDQLKLFV